MTKKTKYIGFRASTETLEHIKELQTMEESLSDIIRNAVEFYYSYQIGINELLKEAHKK